MAVADKAARAASSTRRPATGRLTRSLRLIFLGPPGAGKGTQAELIHHRLGLPHISTGNIFREEANAGTALGQVVAGYMRRGELVPDTVVVQVIAGRLRRPDTRHGYILDGFPRTVPQAEALDRQLARHRQALDLVIYFPTSVRVIHARLGGRRVCRQCGAIYHVTNMPPKRAGVCDGCGGTIIQRTDDRAATIRRRLDVYRQDSTPLLAYYRRCGRLRRLSGDWSAEMFFARFTRLLRREGWLARGG